MDYETIYQRLVSRRKPRVIGEYLERHHIIPRCVGGNDQESNLVLLTPEEHYLAHLLLVRMPLYRSHPCYQKLVFAANMLTCDSKTTQRSNNKRYGWLKRRAAGCLREINTGRKQSPETVEKRASKLRGRIVSSETRRKISEAKRGKKRVFTDEWRDKLNESRRLNPPMKGRRHSEETKAKMSFAKKGRICSPEEAARLRSLPCNRVVSDETRLRMSDAAKRAWDRKTQTQRDEHRASVRNNHPSKKKK